MKGETVTRLCIAVFLIVIAPAAGADNTHTKSKEESKRGVDDTCWEKGKAKAGPGECLFLGDLKFSFAGGLTNTGGSNTDVFEGAGLDRETDTKSTRDWGLGFKDKHILRHAVYFFSERPNAWPLLDAVDNHAEDGWSRTILRLIVHGSTLSARLSRGRTFEEKIVDGRVEEEFNTGSKFNLEYRLELDALDLWKILKTD